MYKKRTLENSKEEEKEEEKDIVCVCAGVTTTWLYGEKQESRKRRRRRRRKKSQQREHGTVRERKSQGAQSLFPQRRRDKELKQNTHTHTERERERETDNFISHPISFLVACRSVWPRLDSSLAISWLLFLKETRRTRPCQQLPAPTDSFPQSHHSLQRRRRPPPPPSNNQCRVIISSPSILLASVRTLLCTCVSRVSGRRTALGWGGGGRLCVSDR